MYRAPLLKKSMLTDIKMGMIRLGAHRRSDGAYEFLLWAPVAQSVKLHLLDSGRFVAMEPREHGYHYAAVEGLRAGVRYMFQLNGERELPDPASRFQPEGVHGPSQLVDTAAFRWMDGGWKGHQFESSIFYELHVGTYTAEGTFDALIPRLPELRDLGVTTIELMPVAQFPGGRNWGYDGVYPFAPQNTYGGPEALQRFVNAAHENQLAVALDVVYNHLGPEGNYLSAYGPYFTDRYHTPWGQAINFDSAGSNEVRRFFIENALYWLEEFHFDTLRLDAIHGIFDFGAQHFLAELKQAVAGLSERLGRELHLVAESDLNDSRILHEPERGGYGLDAQWSDDFHHSLHSLLTKESRGYYGDFGSIEHLAATMRSGWYYDGRHSVYRNRRHGNSAAGIPASRFVVCSQNHDQVGNRAAGDRLSTLVNFEAQKLAAGITLLSPGTPLLFMGEEYGETAPFQYFTSHGDPGLVEAVRRGRREEFAAFGWHGGIPDPQDEKTFLRSRLNHSLRLREPHKTMWELFRQLIQVRNGHKLGFPGQWKIRELEDCALVSVHRGGGKELAVLCNFGTSSIELNLPELQGEWTPVMHSADARWLGPGQKFASRVELAASTTVRLSPQSFLAMERSQAFTEPA